ncbi:CoA transferase [Azorhizobium caulinodans ORS 571]|uniref:CoA transferase n=1 Tax=Azorhizobium caulinodans (strain ATCC 43989 / DSM 5975 / JCM 20966 / LMG 6465 / NBRC 14845 / NCIMB 13405 / ORS 571) TaxID=438753 RepID=A8HRH4_AZOC5|nr:CoA transferase [Azorhizobium caulinodans]BAF87186.1 CoA transferase [Azorhizobium caulinodans ORS 571]
MSPSPTFTAALSEIWTALGGAHADSAAVRLSGAGRLSSAFPVSDLAAASVAAAGLALGTLRAQGDPLPEIAVDSRLASLWFSTSYRPEGWPVPPVWDAVAGDYRTADGWIRLHTNAPHHRAAALSVLCTPADREAVAAAVARWTGEDLEAAIVAANGCAAVMRTQEEWAVHPQGAAVAREPLIWRTEGTASDRPEARLDPVRPLAGVRVLDLTRVLAGPTATRVLAGFGADVLRIDPPFWDEPAVLPDMTLGKRRAHLDLREAEDRQQLAVLLSEADILVHGYRSDALEAMGFGAEARQDIRPGLVDVSLDAYGWTGPWAQRRGFDSLVQMSSGIAHAGMVHYGKDRPTPLPVQALDHATGYLLAAAALRGLAQRREAGRGSLWRTSLARTARLLVDLPAATGEAPLAPAEEADFAPGLEQSAWGPLHRLKPPLRIEGTPMAWDHPAGLLGVDAPLW